MTEFLRFSPQWFRDSGSGAMDAELDPEVNFMLHEVRLNLSGDGATGAGDFTITLESNASTSSDTIFNIVLETQDMEGEDSHIFRPTVEQRILFEEGDILKFEWTNGGATPRDYGLEVIWSPVY